MENGGEGGEGGGRRWGFGPNAALTSVATMSIRGTLNRILSSVDEGGRRPVVPLGHGDPSAFPCFRTTPLAEEAVVAAVRSAQFNSYSSTVGVLSARRLGYGANREDEAMAEGVAMHNNGYQGATGFKDNEEG